MQVLRSLGSNLLHHHLSPRCNLFALKTLGNSRKNFSFSKVMNAKVLSLDTISSKVTKAEYAVRGELVLKANEILKTLQKAKQEGKQSPLPYNEIIFCNIGNPQSLGQRPLTFFRQLVALVEYPELLQSPELSKLFPPDVIERAKRAIAETPGGLGAYSHSQGLSWVRRDIANFIERRDGYPCDPEDLFITNGASPAVQDALRIMIKNENDGIMIPIPQYPLYSASIKLLGGSQVGYYLDEASNWGLSVQELERSYKESKNRGISPKALVIINPGNPTGQVLKEQNMREIVDFCLRNRVVLMADEVYQENVYIKEEIPFVSFKKVLKSMGSKYNDVELFSFHSISKGFVGECGHRGGYSELVNIDPLVKAELYKLASVSLCPNTTGQVLIDVMVNPPKEGDPSFQKYKEERDSIYTSLKRRAEKLVRFLNTLDGVSCNPAQGAMYAFPQVKIPEGAVKLAQSKNKRPDDFYCLELLDKTGVCVVPGSGFGQRDGTYHFRTTFLPPEDQIDGVLSKVAKFHGEFMNKYK